MQHQAKCSCILRQVFTRFYLNFQVNGAALEWFRLMCAVKYQQRRVVYKFLLVQQWLRLLAVVAPLEVKVQLVEYSKLILSNVQVHALRGIAVRVEKDSDITHVAMIEQACVSVDVVFAIRLESNDDVARSFQVRS